MIEHKIKEGWRINFGNLLIYLSIAVGIFALSNIGGWYKLGGLFAAILALLGTTYEMGERDYWLFKKKIVEHKFTIRT